MNWLGHKNEDIAWINCQQSTTDENKPNHKNVFLFLFVGEETKEKQLNCTNEIRDNRPNRPTTKAVTAITSNSKKKQENTLTAQPFTRSLVSFGLRRAHDERWIEWTRRERVRDDDGDSKNSKIKRKSKWNRIKCYQTSEYHSYEMMCDAVYERCMCYGGICCSMCRHCRWYFALILFSLSLSLSELFAFLLIRLSSSISHLSYWTLTVLNAVRCLVFVSIPSIIWSNSCEIIAL